MQDSACYPPPTLKLAVFLDTGFSSKGVAPVAPEPRPEVGLSSNMLERSQIQPRTVCACRAVPRPLKSGYM